MKPIINLLSILSVLIITGCATIQKGQDPLIVRAEQSEQIAATTFDLVVNLDNSNRTFWRTNAPAFHQFAEWVRTPVEIGELTLPRGLAMIRQVDDAKVAYKSNVAQSNALLVAVSSLENASKQAQAWNTIISKPITP
jgi:hypothetical protein